MKKFVFVLVFLFAVSGYANAQGTLALQEKCAEGAKKFVKQLSNVQFFTNHYNKKLDKCFIRVTFDLGQSKDKDGKIHYRYQVQLCDVFENTVLGSFSSIDDGIGVVGNKTCKSMEEFEALIKPYMEE